MPHKISQRQFDQLRALAPGRSRWSSAWRLLDGDGTVHDLDVVVEFCIKLGANALARELLQPSDQLGGVD